MVNITMQSEIEEYLWTSAKHKKDITRNCINFIHHRIFKFED